MSALRHDRLLVSSVNGGGVFHLDADGAEPLSSIDTSGLARCADGTWLLARQDELSNELRRYAGADWSSHEVVPHVLDLHDVLVHEDRVYVVATEINAVLQLDPVALREVRRWRLEGEPDSSHVNSICVHQGRLLASRFGQFRNHRGYKGITAGAGEVYDVETGEVVIAGLSQPHSLTPRGDALWLCDSEARVLRCYRGFAQVRSVDLDGYVRGVAFGIDGIHVGLSRSRNDSAPGPASAMVVTLDPETLRQRAATTLPVGEVYDIRTVDVGLEQLRRSAARETHAEVARQRQARRGAEASAIEAHGTARSLADALHQANLRIAALEAGDEEEAARVGTLERTAADDATWAGLLDAEVARLEDMLDRQARELDTVRAWMTDAVSTDAQLRDIAATRADQLRAAAEALQAKDAYIGLITGSRRWRFTAWLGQGPAVPPTPGTPRDDAIPEPLAPPAGIARVERGAGPRRAMIPVSGLAFDVHPAPRVSIVVTGCTRYADALGCLVSLQAAGAAVPFEVIAVDGSAGDEEMQRFRSVPGLRWVEGVGGEGAASAGADASSGEFIAFVDAGTRVRRGWVDALLATFPIFPDCAMVAPRLLSADGRLREAGRIVWADASSSSLGEGEAPDDLRYAVVREVDGVAGAALLVRAATFREIGGFAAAGLRWEHAVADLGFRMRAAGRRVHLQPAAAVVQPAPAVDDVEAAGPQDTASRDAFATRWREVLAREHWPRGEQPFLARDRGQLKRTVLVVDHRAPEPDRDAGSRAIWHLLRVLHLFGFNVKFWAVSAGEDPRYAIGLRVHGVELLDEQHNGPLDAWLQEHGGCVDHVVLSRPMVAWACIDAVRRHSGASVLYYGHDIHHQRLQRQYELGREDWLPPHIAHVRGIEEALWRTCDLVLYPTEEETQYVRAWLAGNAPAGGRAETVPLFAYEGPHVPVPGPETRRDVMFVGSYQHAPNEDGAYWFASDVWPLIRQARGDLRLCLIGAGASERLRALAASDVVIAGPVDEATLARHYDAARVAVAPLRFGAGLKGKIIEAMQHGVPCVTTTVGAQGLTPARFLHVADTPDTMAAKILHAAGDDAGWRQASEDAQAYVAARFSVHTVWAVLRLAMDNTPYASVEARRLRIAANHGTAARDHVPD